MSMSESTHKPPTDFQVNDKDPLIDLSSINPNKELWLLQYPSNQVPGFNGQQISFKLNGDGTLASFGSLSGKSYELVSFASQQPDATVFHSSKTGSKVVGKISRRVSLIHYPEPSELEKFNSHRSAEFYQRSAATSKSASRRSKHTSSSGITQQTTSLFDFGGSSKRSKKNHDAEPSQGSMGRGQSDVSSLGSADNSGRKSKKNKHEK